MLIMASIHKKVNEIRLDSFESLHDGNRVPLTY